MANLTSTVPAAFNAFHALLVAAGAAQSPPVEVFHSTVQQEEPSSYVLLGDTMSGHKAVENHRFEAAALGAAQYPQYEEYDICGYATTLQGDVDPATTMTNTWALYQSVVMSTVVANRGSGGFVLGVSSTPIAFILPDWADYHSEGAKNGGYWGVVEFGFHIKSRITVS